jgi:hypothetical protein
LHSDFPRLLKIWVDGAYADLFVDKTVELGIEGELPNALTIPAVLSFYHTARLSNIHLLGLAFMPLEVFDFVLSQLKGSFCHAFIIASFISVFVYPLDIQLICIKGKHFSKGMPAIRLIGEDMKPQAFDVYSPKILAVITGLKMCLPAAASLSPCAALTRKCHFFHPISVGRKFAISFIRWH